MENTKQPSPNFIQILLRIQGQLLPLKFSRDSLLPEEGRIIKFYDSDVNCLGISFRHQLADFKKFLSNLQVSAQSGYFLKVCFFDRIGRDLFLL